MGVIWRFTRELSQPGIDFGSERRWNCPWVEYGGVIWIRVIYFRLSQACLLRLSSLRRSLRLDTYRIDPRGLSRLCRLTPRHPGGRSPVCARFPGPCSKPPISLGILASGSAHRAWSVTIWSCQKPSRVGASRLRGLQRAVARPAFAALETVALCRRWCTRRPLQGRPGQRSTSWRDYRSWMLRSPCLNIALQFGRTIKSLPLSLMAAVRAIWSFRDAQRDDRSAPTVTGQFARVSASKTGLSLRQQFPGSAL